MFFCFVYLLADISFYGKGQEHILADKITIILPSWLFFHGPMGPMSDYVGIDFSLWSSNQVHE